MNGSATAARYIACLILPIISGCLPTEMPAYAPDNRHIVLVANDPATNMNALWVCDAIERTAVPHYPPDGWKLEQATYVEEQLWMSCSREEGILVDQKTGKVVIDKATNKPARNTLFMWAQFDLKTDRFIEGAPKLRNSFLSPPCVIGYRGKKLLLYQPLGEADNISISTTATMPSKLELLGESNISYETLEVPSLKNPLTLKGQTIIPAGKDWSIRLVTRDPYKGQGELEGKVSELAGMEVFDAKGGKTCLISKDMISKACPHEEVQFPVYVRVSDDGSVIALSFDDRFGKSRPWYTFGVYETQSGKLLWCGGSDSLWGTPLVTSDAIWTLEDDIQADTESIAERPVDCNPHPCHSFSLVRHVRPEKDGDAGRRQKILVYGVGKTNVISEFAPDPKRKNFLVNVAGEKPQLLIVPIRETANENDIIAIDLKNPKTLPATAPVSPVTLPTTPETIVPAEVRNE